MQHAPRAAGKKNLLLCFDAFGTLFAPRRPIAVQYGEVARRHGITGFSDHDLQASFGRAFKEESKEHPNYGKVAGMKAPEWWATVISRTFKPLMAQDQPLPERLIPDLLTRFSTKEGYSVFPDVLPFFSMLRAIKREPASNRSDDLWPWERTVIGIITNSDDRIPGILTSLGLSVGARRAGSAEERIAKAKADDDISFVVLSYDVGCEKPDRRIFEAAQQLLADTLKESPESGPSSRPEDFELLYVGDDVRKDVLGAMSAGWHGVLVDRDGFFATKFADGRSIIRYPARRFHLWQGDEAHMDKMVDVIADLRSLGDWRPPER